MATYLLANGVVIAEVVPGTTIQPRPYLGNFWKNYSGPTKPTVNVEPGETVLYTLKMGRDGEFYYDYKITTSSTVVIPTLYSFYKPREAQIVRWLSPSIPKIRMRQDDEGLSPILRYLNGQRVSLALYNMDEDGWGWVKFKPANDAFPEDLRIHATRLDTNENYASGTAFIVDINGTTKVRLNATNDHTAGDFS